MRPRRPTTSCSPFRALLFVPCAALIVVGCDSPAREESPAVRSQRIAAYRQACVSRLLAERADDNLEVLVASAQGVDPNDPIAAISRQATQAALQYGRAYQSHAALRASAYAYLDSAVNHARTPTDSVRYIERAATFSIRMPAEGSVEANVLNAYQNEMTAMISNLDHPCNWDFPF